MKFSIKCTLFNMPVRLVVFAFVATFMLAACDSQNEPEVESLGENLSFKIPDKISAKLAAGGTLTATVSVNGGTPQALRVIGATASGTVSGVPIGSTSFTVVFTYDQAPFGPLVIASATQTINVTTGNNSLAFANGDYDTASFDADGDGISNILELEELSTTSPISCTLGVAATLGTCELGP